MRLSSVPFSHFFGLWLEIAPRIRAALSCGFPVLVDNNASTRALYRYRKPGKLAPAPNPLQEVLS
jgi:hypothetical protein